MKTLLQPVSPHAALLLRRSKRRILVIADLHIGWESGLSQQGIHIPSQTPRLIKKLEEVVHVASPTELVILGDVKHAIAKVDPLEWRDVPEFFEKALRLVPTVMVVPGNHDGNLESLTPREIRIFPSSGTRVTDDVGLVHGHAWPLPEVLGCSTLVMAHVHPVVLFSDSLGLKVSKQVWIKASCNKTNLARGILKGLKVKVNKPIESEFRERFETELRTSRCIIIPPFNDFIGGQSINRKGSWTKSKVKEEYIGPILRSQSVDMENGEVHMLDGTFLGKVSQLRAFT